MEKISCVLWHEISPSTSRMGIAIDVANNGYHILDTVKWRQRIAATVIYHYPNGLGAIEWLDDEDRSLYVYHGKLDDAEPGTRFYLPRLGVVTEYEVSNNA